MCYFQSVNFGKVFNLIYHIHLVCSSRHIKSWQGRLAKCCNRDDTRTSLRHVVNPGSYLQSKFDANTIVISKFVSHSHLQEVWTWLIKINSRPILTILRFSVCRSLSVNLLLSRFLSFSLYSWNLYIMYSPGIAKPAARGFIKEEFIVIPANQLFTHSAKNAANSICKKLAK